eukprot:CAMPEP_0195107210 /NCGR_PEP_ID=MMETSP0448-20130528/81947_1 /TAXON_ID=66468 /ORGANISM="Heterocapsa triquestra, Strain CCMP 448" /LENGTH=175 /DNA_ID=CAMNT_0040143621 /DNA_START=26 /DNA_END=554 /DNA_ORIENTATION=+
MRIGATDPRKLPTATDFYKVGLTTDMKKRTASFACGTPFRHAVAHSVVVPNRNQSERLILGLSAKPKHFDGGSEWRTYSKRDLKKVKALLDEEQAQWHDLKKEFVHDHELSSLMASRPISQKDMSERTERLLAARKEQSEYNETRATVLLPRGSGKASRADVVFDLRVAEAHCSP